MGLQLTQAYPPTARLEGVGGYPEETVADLSAHVKGLVKVMFETFPQWEQFVSASVASAARRSRLQVPWDPDDPPADINAMMKLLIGEHGILTNFPLSHNMLRTIAHVPLEGEELPRPCALGDPDAPPCKPYATVAEREERVAAVQRMRDDTSEVGL